MEKEKLAEIIIQITLGLIFLPIGLVMYFAADAYSKDKDANKEILNYFGLSITKKLYTKYIKPTSIVMFLYVILALVGGIIKLVL